jgi:hypothetical protein
LPAYPSNFPQSEREATAEAIAKATGIEVDDAFEAEH